MKTILILIFLSILKLVYSLNLALSPDEAYYWEWSRQLELSYYDQGPGVALYIRIFTSIFGNNQFAIKLAAIISSVLSIIAIYYTGIKMDYSKNKLLLLFGILFLLPGFFYGSVFIMHDSVLILCWTISIYMFASYLKSEKPIYIYLLFAFMGIGALGKHTMLFFAISLVLWLVISPKYYSLLTKKSFYLGLLVAALIVLPVVYWNLQNDWENLDAILNLRSSGGAEYDRVTTQELIVGQLLTFSPLWGIAVFYMMFLFWKHSPLVDKNSTNYHLLKFLLINGSILPVFFLIMSFKKVTQPNWVFPSYPALVLCLVYFYKSDTNTSIEVYYKKLIQFGFVIAILFNLFTLFSYSLKDIFHLRYYHTVARFLGYKEAIDKIQAIQKNHPNSILIANRYQDAAIASWYIDGKPRVTSINILQRNQYNHWNKMEKGKDYLIFYIQENTCEKSLTIFEAMLKEMFVEFVTYPEEDLMIGGEAVKRYQVWYGKNLVKEWHEVVFPSLNQNLWNLHTANLIPFEDAAGTSNKQSKIVDSILNYFSRKGEFDCGFLK